MYMENTDLMNVANEVKELLHYYNSGDWVHDCSEKGIDPDDWCKAFNNDLVSACNKFINLYNEEEVQENQKKAANVFLQELTMFLDSEINSKHIDIGYFNAFQFAVSWKIMWWKTN